MSPDAFEEWPLPRPYDFFETTRTLRLGSRDPTVRREVDGLWRTAHTKEGPATVRLILGDVLQAQAWGPGASAAVSEVPRWVGLTDAPWQLPSHPIVDRLMRRHRGLRGTDTGHVFEALMQTVLQQLVTWVEAALTWRRLCETLGEPAPGPAGLMLAPTPRAVRAAEAARLQAIGIGRQRARTLLEVATAAHALEAAATLETHQATKLLQQVRGIGPWSAAHVLGYRFARPEPLLLGDYHLPNTIGWALAGEPRATEARMLELLEPFDGYAFRIVRLLHAARIQAPRWGPRRPFRNAATPRPLPRTQER